MTEEWWQKYKKNKEKTQNHLFNDVESELKRRFKAEKSPEEMFSMCKTDNNYWKHYRSSENLEEETIGVVLCKDIGCDLMYCQALTFSKQASTKNIETYGCTEQFNALRHCYLTEKRKFNSKFTEKEWMENRQIIPEYIKKELQLRKIDKEKMKYSNIDLPDVVPTQTDGKITVNKDDGYF